MSSRDIIDANYIHHYLSASDVAEDYRVAADFRVSAFAPPTDFRLQLRDVSVSSLPPNQETFAAMKAHLETQSRNEDGQWNGQLKSGLSWRYPSNQVQQCKRWRNFVDDEIRHGLGFKTDLGVEFGEALLCTSGQSPALLSAARHSQDTYATLIIQLPSKFEGDPDRVHAGSQVVPLVNIPAAKLTLVHLTAIFGNTEYEMVPPTSGSRLVLIYHLVRLVPSALTPADIEFAKKLREWKPVLHPYHFRGGALIPLSRKYEREELSFDKLLGGDKVMGQKLLRVATEAPIRVALANMLITVHKMAPADLAEQYGRKPSSFELENGQEYFTDASSPVISVFTTLLDVALPRESQSSASSREWVSEFVVDSDNVMPLAEKWSKTHSPTSAIYTGREYRFGVPEICFEFECMSALFFCHTSARLSVKNCETASLCMITVPSELSVDSDNQDVRCAGNHLNGEVQSNRLDFLSYYYGALLPSQFVQLLARIVACDDVRAAEHILLTRPSCSKQELTTEVVHALIDAAMHFSIPLQNVLDCLKLRLNRIADCREAVKVCCLRAESLGANDPDFRPLCEFSQHAFRHLITLVFRLQFQPLDSKKGRSCLTEYFSLFELALRYHSFSRPLLTKIMRKRPVYSALTSEALPRRQWEILMKLLMSGIEGFELTEEERKEAVELARFTVISLVDFCWQSDNNDDSRKIEILPLRQQRFVDLVKFLAGGSSVADLAEWIGRSLPTGDVTEIVPALAQLMHDNELPRHFVHNLLGPFVRFLFSPWASQVSRTRPSSILLDSVVQAGSLQLFRALVNISPYFLTFIEKFFSADAEYRTKYAALILEALRVPLLYTKKCFFGISTLGPGPLLSYVWSHPLTDINEDIQDFLSSLSVDDFLSAMQQGVKSHGSVPVNNAAYDALIRMLTKRIESPDLHPKYSAEATALMDCNCEECQKVLGWVRLGPTGVYFMKKTQPLRKHIAEKICSWRYQLNRKEREPTYSLQIFPSSPRPLYVVEDGSSRRARLVEALRLILPPSDVTPPSPSISSEAYESEDLVQIYNEAITEPVSHKTALTVDIPDTDIEAASVHAGEARLASSSDGIEMVDSPMTPTAKRIKHDVVVIDD